MTAAPSAESTDRGWFDAASGLHGVVVAEARGRFNVQTTARRPGKSMQLAAASTQLGWTRCQSGARNQAVRSRLLNRLQVSDASSSESHDFQ